MLGSDVLGGQSLLALMYVFFFPLANRKLTSGSCVHQSIIAMAKIPDRNGGRVSLGHSGQVLVDRARWGGWKGPSGQGVIEQHVMTGKRQRGKEIADILSWLSPLTLLVYLGSAHGMALPTL